MVVLSRKRSVFFCLASIVLISYGSASEIDDTLVQSTKAREDEQEPAEHTRRRNLQESSSCPDDDSWMYTSSRRIRTCEWVSKRPEKRCNQVGDDDRLASEACYESCGTLCILGPTAPPEPTASPSTAPSFPPGTCRDDPNWVDKKDKNCDWVGQRTSRRCEKSKSIDGVLAMDGCPETCGTCTSTGGSEGTTISSETCEDDSSWTVKTGKRTRDCTWIGVRPDKRCDTLGEDGRLAADACYNSCGSPCPAPTSTPSIKSSFPTLLPSSKPSDNPSVKPSAKPSDEPSTVPTLTPIDELSSDPSTKPSNSPSARPSTRPTKEESESDSEPSDEPSNQPSNQPSRSPSEGPSIKPVEEESDPEPSDEPSNDPSDTPSSSPSETPSIKPAEEESDPEPSDEPSNDPSAEPSSDPSSLPSERPTQTETVNEPSNEPSTSPSNEPSHDPSSRPSATPTVATSSVPTTAPKQLVIAGDNGTPTSAFPLGVCEGDCDGSEQCEWPLLCFERSGTESVSQHSG